LNAEGKTVVSTRVSYNSNHEITRVSNGETSTSISYNNFGLQTQVSDTFLNSTGYRYDKYNRLQSVTVPNGVKTHYLYNADGLVSQISRTCPMDDVADAVKVGKQPPKGSLGGEYMLSSINISYNADGQPVSISDSMGRVKTLDRNEMGRIIKEHFPNKTTNAYEYTVTGQISKVLDSRDNPIRFKWNKFGKVEQKKTAVGQYTDYVYNDYGQLESIVSRFSKKNSVDREIKYTYDEFDRLTTVDYGKGQKKTFTYDSWGKLLKAVSTDGDTRRDLVNHYDEFDRVARSTEAVFVKGKAQSGIKRTYAYSPYGKRTRLTVTTYGLAGGKMTKQDVIKNTWEYNKFGQLAKITKGKDTVEYLYNRQGKVLKRTANAMETYYTYTPLGQLETKSLGAPFDKGTAIATLKYIYATDGSINARLVNGVKQSYQYDQMGQLTAVLNASGAKVEQYVYDNAGNILKKDIGGKVTTYTYDKANQLVSSTCDGKTTDYEYDAAGRMVKEGAKSYTYGWLDKVMNITVNGKITNSYSYSMDGQVASSSEVGTDLRAVRTDYLWDGLALLKRGTTEYVNEPAVTGGNPILANGKGLFNDMLGNSLGVAEKDKFTAIKRDAFGKTLENSAGSAYNMFTGKPQVSGLGYTFLFRNYRPSLGKWQTQDPLGYPDGWNNLAYCTNKVTSCFDWLGGTEIAGTKYIDTQTDTNQHEYGEWVTVGSPFYTAGGTLVQEYQRSVKTFDLVKEYEVTPYYDSTWAMVDDIGDGVLMATGATLGGILGSLVGGAAGAYVGVVAGGVITYYVCQWTSPNPTRIVWGSEPINTYQTNVSYDYAVKYEVVAE
jgi:RHS repeat-associated protein